MDWLARFKSRKEPERKAGRTRIRLPVCSECEEEIPCLDRSIGDVIEDQGAFIYGGSEGHLYEPLFGGVICLSCKTILCDSCLANQVDKSRCGNCGGTFRRISERRLPDEYKTVQ